MWPQSGDFLLPYAALYGVPAVVHTTSVPSPMSQVTWRTRAVAVTVMPPAVADSVIGPHVCAFGVATHIQTGMPTMPMLSSPGFRCDADVDGPQAIRSIASCATSRGVGPAPEFGGGSADHIEISRSVCGW